MEGYFSKRQLSVLRSTVCKNVHDENIFDFCLKIKIPSFESTISSINSNIKRFIMVRHIKDLCCSWLEKYMVEVDHLVIIRWFYTQKLIDFHPKDPLFPNCTDRNEGLYHELRKGGVPEKEIIHFENLINQMVRSFNIVDIEDKRNVTILEEGNIIKLCYDNKSFQLNKTYYQNLYNQLTDISVNARLSKMFNLLCRYTTFSAPGYHAAIPVKVFDVLIKYLKVEHEIFASPLNRTLESYTSAYPDVDKYFGSKGDFFHVYPKLFENGGSFEANPPFLEEYMTAFALIAVHYLSKDIPLSFVVIVPAWTDTILYHIFVTSSYNVLPNKYLSFGRHEHCYRHGSDYAYVNESKRPANNRSFIFILQNKLGQIKYPVTGPFIEEVGLSFAI